MADKMTPGPWKVSRSGFNVERTDMAATIAILQPSANMKADARAIAALPDLIAAAKPIAETLSGSSDDMTDTLTVSITVGELRAIRAALAKAGITE